MTAANKKNQGHLLISVESTSLSQDDKVLLQHPAVAGLVLFTRNYENPVQLKSLTKEIHEINPRLIISVDQEGEKVQRFVDGFTSIPSSEYFGKLYEENPVDAKQQIVTTFNRVSEELEAVGVNCNLIPVLDVNHNISEIISNRSFHRDLTIINTLAETLVDALHARGFPAIGKHFPGHGGVAADSHLDLPVDDRDRETLKNIDIAPFCHLLRKLDALMTAHVIYPAFDDLPVTLSPYWLKTLLRDKFNYSGVVMSDCLSMAAMHRYGDFVGRAEMAIAAGCDLLIVCNDRDGAIAILDSGLTTDRAAQERVSAFAHYCWAQPSCKTPDSSSI